MMQGFRETMRECNLMDLGCKGCPVTWSNKRYGHDLIEERLARFLGNKEWSCMFLESAAETLESWASDHNPILMNVVEKGRGLRYKRRIYSRVHYEDLWSSYEKCREIIRQNWLEQGRWNKEDAVECFRKITKQSMIQLQFWSGVELNDRNSRTEKLIKELKEMKQNNRHYEDSERIRKLEKQIDSLC